MSIRKIERNFFSINKAIMIFCFPLATSMTFQAAASELNPLVAGPGVSNQNIRAYAEANSSLLYSDWLDTNRPSQELNTRLSELISKAQEAWVSGNIESARVHFRQITSLTLAGDWREPQREAILYSYLRMAQSAATPVEKGEWIEKSIHAFNDLIPDPELFPPPLIKNHSDSRERILKASTFFEPAQHFPGYRYFVVNGRRYEINEDLKIRLPEATYRISAYSDIYPEVTDIFSRTQLTVFKISLPRLASGTCREPESQLKNVSVLFLDDCLRKKSDGVWEQKNVDLLELDRFHSEIKNPMPKDGEIKLPFSEKAEARPTISKKSLGWIAISALFIGGVYLAHKELSKAPHVETTHTYGF